MTNFRMKLRDKLLHIPFLVDTTDLTDGQIDRLFDLMEAIGGTTFRARELTKECLSDVARSAKQPLTYGQIPYLTLSMNDKSELRIVVSSRTWGGCTVYAFSQVDEIIGNWIKAGRCTSCLVQIPQ